MRVHFPVHATLTGRERDVLRRLLRGWSIPEISSDLQVTLSTGRMHLRNLHAKTRTNNLHALTLWAITHHQCCLETSDPPLPSADLVPAAANQFRSLLLDSMSQALIATGTDDRVIAWNTRAEELYGWLEEEALGRPIYELTVPKVNEDEARAIMEALARGERWTGEFMVTRRDGSTFLALVQNAPILVEGQFVGVIGLSEDITERRRTEESLEQVKREKVRADEQLWNLAHYDELTGLPNERLLRERLRQAVMHAGQSGEKVAVHKLGLDDFKDVRAALGATASNEVIREVAERLATIVGDGGTLGRLYSSEFVVVQTSVRSDLDVERLAGSLVAALGSSFTLEGGKWHVTASCGVAVYPEDGDDFAVLSQAAESAMHAARDMRTGVRFFSPAFTATAQERFEIGSELRDAVEDDRLRVAFQPIVRASDGAVIEVEALARFESPTRGMVGPDVFIPIAEASGLIIPLSRQIRSRSLEWLRHWREAGVDVSLGLNVSSLVLADEAFEDELREAVTEHGVPPSRLTLEITESVLLSHTAQSMTRLQRLRDEGYGLAVDDFGTGFSMLASLRSRSLTSLKIDQVFVAELESDERNHALLRFAIGLGHDLGLKVVAEGVETEAQYRFLREEGVDACQGYLFARPMPGEEVAAFWARQNRLEDRR